MNELLNEINRLKQYYVHLDENEKPRTDLAESRMFSAGLKLAYGFIIRDLDDLIKRFGDQDEI